MTKEYIPGQDCGCYAYNESECGCGADWTPSEVYELREQVKNLLSKMEGMGYRHSHERALADRLAEALRELCETLLADKPRDITELLNKAGDAIAAWKEARSE